MERGDPLSIEVTQCGVKFRPPSLAITYESGGRMGGLGGGRERRRVTMPVRNLTKKSDVARVAADMRGTKSGKRYLGGIKDRQLLKLLSLLRDHLTGLSLEESLEKSAHMETINPDEDLNKVDDETLKRKKAVMEESFSKNSIKPGDAEFTYDKEVDFGQEDGGGPIETANWSDEDEC